MQKKIKNILYGILILLFLNCSQKYQQFLPCSQHKVEIKFQDKSEKEIISKFIFSVPCNYQPTKSLPLVIALHGYGSNAEAFHDLWKQVTDSMGYVLLTPQGENKTEENFGFYWGDHAKQSILACFDVLQKSVKIDKKRVYLVGFSAGGRLVYDLGLKQAQLFHGLAPLSAPFDEKFLPPNKVVPFKINVYISHGELESKIGNDAKLAAKKLEGLGLKVKYVEYKRLGHDLPEPKRLELKRILKYLDN